MGIEASNADLEVYDTVTLTCADPEGWTGGPDLPPEKSQKYRFFSNTGPDPFKITKLPSQHSRLGHHQHASETPFKRRFADGPMMARINLKNT